MICVGLQCLGVRNGRELRTVVSLIKPLIKDQIRKIYSDGLSVESREEFVTENNDMIRKVEEICLQQKNFIRLSKLYCIDKGLAEFMRDRICSLTTNNDFKNAYFYEANPGAGILTEALLQSKIQNLCVFEKISSFIDPLKKLEKQYPGKLEIIQQDLLSLPRLKYYKSDAVETEIFKKLKVHQWNESPTVTIIAALSPHCDWKFCRFLLGSISEMDSIFCYGRPECFLTISEREYTRMTATEKDSYVKYRSASVLYRLFFNINLIEKISKQCFLPIINGRKSKQLANSEYYYFIQIVPKPDLFKAVVAKEYLPDLHFFVTQCLSRRKNLVFPTIEKWLPGSTPMIIKSDIGIGIFTRFGELPPSKILELFHRIICLPEYEESTLKVAVHQSDEE